MGGSATLTGKGQSGSRATELLFCSLAPGMFAAQGGFAGAAGNVKQAAAGMERLQQ